MDKDTSKTLSNSRFDNQPSFKEMKFKISRLNNNTLITKKEEAEESFIIDKFLLFILEILF